MFTYLTWRGDLDFNQSPFNPVDNIILSQLSYLPLDGIVPGIDDNSGITIHQASEIFEKKIKSKTAKEKPVIIYKHDPALIATLGASNRFGNCRLLGYVNYIDNEKEIQFSALSIIPNESFNIIVYKGTDLSLVGWKEDINMSYCEIVPSQIEAAAYLEKMADILKGNLILCGHSKGGNLAAYASAYCKQSIRDRITDIYTNDSPGFHKKVFDSYGFNEITGRINSFVPQSSVIGMLLDRVNDYSVVKSTQKGLLQHNLYSWEIMYNDLVRLDRVTQGSRFVDKTLHDWINNLDREHREQFFEALYNILKSSKVNSLDELESSWLSATGNIIKSIGRTDDQTKELIQRTFNELFYAAKNNLKKIINKPALKRRIIKP
jgi:hypothetical protein